MKQLTLFDYPPTRDEIPGDIEPDRYGRGQQKLESIQYEEDDPAYITPPLKNDSPTTSTPPKKPVGESRITNDSKPFTRVYHPKGTARTSNQYFSLNYRTPSGKRTDRHICGGNINQPTAIEKRKAIEEAIAQGQPIEQLLRLCQ